MKSSTFTFKDDDGIEIFVYKWAHDKGEPKAVIQIAHGLAEHAGRYERVAKVLTSAGYICYADDHRGHGKTGGEKDRGYLGVGGWDKVVNDLKQLNDIIKNENPGIPCFLIGHSWGSFLFQDYIQQWGNDIEGVILSGTNGYTDEEKAKESRELVNKSIKEYGPKKINEKFNEKLFGNFNKPFEPAETAFEWLSRDKEEVKKYVEDPLCGFACTTNLYDQLFYGTEKIWKEENEKKIPTDLPMFIISGSEDPVSNMAENLYKLIDRYEEYGIFDISFIIYQGARHEIFNEINRKEVFNDVINWLDSHL
ncbi:MAG: lysophospholipase [Promethearchaeota archaeon]